MVMKTRLLVAAAIGLGLSLLFWSLTEYWSFPHGREKVLWDIDKHLTDQRIIDFGLAFKRGDTDLAYKLFNEHSDAFYEGGAMASKRWSLKQKADWLANKCAPISFLILIAGLICPRNILVKG
jgi:hypothetical protein